MQDDRKGDWMTQISVLLIAHPQNRQSQGSSEVSNFKSKRGLFQRFSRSTHTELTPIKPVAADEPKNNDLKKTPTTTTKDHIGVIL